MEEYRLAVLLLLGAAVVYFDLRYRLIPDRIILAGLVLGLPFYKNICWAVAYGGTVLVLAALTGGIGGGDVKYIFLLAVYLGETTWAAVSTAAAMMAIPGLVLVAFKKIKPRDRLAFGPFLVCGSIFAALGGDHLWKIFLIS